QDTILICPPVVSQYAALGALQAGKAYCQGYLREIAAVRSIVLDALKPLTGLCEIGPADGAFYVFLKVNTELDSFTVVERLIREYQVAVIPGNTFGMTGGCYLRVAYGALQPDTATEGIDRLVRGLPQILT
ncbi:MAG: aminotransferase class I/II-fold pyridoxal phosphate-dependent enzyme, partial [Geitlerinemataceae cyanobacterium]